MSSTFAQRRSELLADSALRGLTFCRTYSAAVDTWLAELLGDAPGIALVAIGAYGRSELCPGSDLDVMLVHRGERGVDVNAIAGRVWYPIWDAGVSLDHSVRTVREALAVTDRDLKSAMSLLDTRVVAGDSTLGDDLRRRVHEQWNARLRPRLSALDDLVTARHRANLDIAQALEPNLKEGKGGIRDLAILRAAISLTPVWSPDTITDTVAATLFDTRVALQRRSGRSDVLILDYQDAVAAELDLADADDLMSRVSESGRGIGWASDEAWRSVRSWMRGPRGRSSVGADRALGPSIVLRDDEVAIVADADATEAALMFRVAATAAYEGAPIAKATVQRFVTELGAPADPWPPATRDAFVALLGGGRASLELLEALDHHGLLRRVLPEWETVRSHPQRNAFHRFTVDRHLLETVAEACRLTRQVRRPDLLLVGALLHDIGKGTPGDHTVNGITLADTIATRMGFSRDDVATIVGMIRHHLLLPAVATGRDLSDPATSAAVAAAVTSEELLDLLHALTEADSIATGPAAWSTWKADLLGRLVSVTRDALAGRAAPVALLEPAVPAHLRDGNLHVEGADGSVTIVARHSQDLFAVEVGLLGVHAQEVRSAWLRTEDGLAISEFTVEPERGRPADWHAFTSDLEDVLREPDRVAQLLEARAAPYRVALRPQAARPAPTRVLVDADATTRGTVVEVRTADGIGVLYRITHALTDLGLRIGQARVSTLGHEVVDTFYVTMTDETKVTDRAVLAAIAPTVITALAPDPSSDENPAG